MEESSNEVRHIGNDGHIIIELLCQADSLLREELRTLGDGKTSLEIRPLFEAQLNISRAIEALYDRVSYRYTF
jgi:hypothetical protein